MAGGVGATGSRCWHAAVAARKVRLPDSAGLISADLPLRFGSGVGKFATPWARMQAANLTIRAYLSGAGPPAAPGAAVVVVVAPMCATVGVGLPPQAAATTASGAKAARESRVAFMRLLAPAPHSAPILESHILESHILEKHGILGILTGGGGHL